MNKSPKIIVLDDDPTGSQTVHSCLLLMQWDVETLKMGLLDTSPIVFILTREVCQNLKVALAQTDIQEFLVVSRSDSTLRGHYPIETDAMAEELGPFDAHFMVPAFLEGGRITVDSIHYIEANGMRTPVHETEFARDSAFAYHHSYLPDYVAEKTNHRIQAGQVERFTVDRLRQGTFDALMNLHDNVCVAVDAEVQSDLDRFAQDLRAAAGAGKRFLFRSAASLLTSLANLPPQPVAATDMAKYTRGGKPGAVIVGSHVNKTTQQLNYLLKEPGIVGIEVDVNQLLDPSEQAFQSLLASVLAQVSQHHHQGLVSVVYTSRVELAFDTVATRLAFGERVSAFLMAVERGLPSDIGFLISKGGITSNDTLSQGLSLRAARLLGQVLPGVSMVTTPEDHPLFPLLPVVLFPGNVGGEDAVATVYQRLRSMN
jgi:uncharacterized protein YgbK (DUF1537 family)